MGKLKRKFGNLDVTPLSEGLISEVEFEEVFDPYNKKGTHIMFMFRKKRDDKRKKTVDAIRQHNESKFDPGTAPTRAIYVGLPWSQRSNYLKNIKYKCDDCGQDIAVDTETQYMADNCSAVICITCAAIKNPELLERDIENIRKSIK